MPAPLDPKEKTRRTRLGGRIREYRLWAGLTLDELARRVSSEPDAPSVDRRHVLKWETGKAPLPDDLMRRISGALGVDTRNLSDLHEVDLPLRSRLVAFSTEKPAYRYEIHRGKGVMIEAARSALEQHHVSRGTLHFDAPVVFKPAQALDQQLVETMAEKIRRRWELGTAPVADVVQMLEEHQVVVIIQAKANTTAQIFAGSYCGWPVVYWCGPTPSTSVEQQDLRLRVLSAALRTMALMRGLTADDAKEQAARVARAVLLPAERIGFHFGSRINVTAANVMALSNRYGLPADLAVLRMVETGAVPAHVGELLMRSLGGAEFVYRREYPLGAAILPSPM